MTQIAEPPAPTQLQHHLLSHHCSPPQCYHDVHIWDIPNLFFHSLPSLSSDKFMAVCVGIMVVVAHKSLVMWLLETKLIRNKAKAKGTKLKFNHPSYTCHLKTTFCPLIGVRKIWQAFWWIKGPFTRSYVEVLKEKTRTVNKEKILK